MALVSCSDSLSMCRTLLRDPTHHMTHLHGLPAPLTVLGVVCHPPHVHVALDDLGSQDVVPVAQPGRRSLRAPVKAEGLRAQLGG